MAMASAVSGAIGGVIGTAIGVLASRSGCCGPLPSLKKAGENSLPRKTSGCKSSSKDAVVIVDPLSTGAKLAAEAIGRGYKVIRVFSAELPEALLQHAPASCSGLTFESTIYFNEKDPSETVKELQALDCNIVAVQVGCESGVEAYDALVDAMTGYPNNDIAYSAARRDKYQMGECVREAKLRAVKQIEVTMWDEETRTFLKDELRVHDCDPNGPWCVLKPTKSAGSDGVYIAKTMEEACEAFQRILGATDAFGATNQTVLVQEFLKGTEYIVDSVSMNGEHKCVAIWEYDKRPINGAPFVSFGQRFYQSEDGERERKLVEYMHSVLDALGIRHGPSHGEVMWLDHFDEPCLVEVGSRPHGGDGYFKEVLEKLIGYSQVSVAVDIFDKPERFNALPSRPARFSGLCAVPFLVSTNEGTLEAYTPSMVQKMKQMQSYKTHEFEVPVGNRLEITVDIMTKPGWVSLMHADAEVVEKDMKQVHDMGLDGSLFTLQSQDAILKLASPNLKRL